MYHRAGAAGPLLYMANTEFTPLEDAAAEVGLHRSTVRGYIRRGLLKGWRRPGDARTFIDLEELRRLRDRRSTNE
jgi:DNA-binding transcriptional MerR regulator